jgi:hypothetical protein
MPNTRLVAPTEQLLGTDAVGARNLGDQNIARKRLGDDPRLGFRRPAPSAPGTGDHLDPAKLFGLGVNRMVVHKVKSILSRITTMLHHDQPS